MKFLNIFETKKPGSRHSVWVWGKFISNKKKTEISKRYEMYFLFFHTHLEFLVIKPAGNQTALTISVNVFLLFLALNNLYF